MSLLATCVRGVRKRRWATVIRPRSREAHQHETRQVGVEFTPVARRRRCGLRGSGSGAEETEVLWL